MPRRCFFLLLVLGLSLFAKDADRWEPDIQAFEKADKADAPPKGGVVFIGSSSIRKWNLDKWFPDLHAVNRGFGGSQIADSIQYADRILIPLKPKTVVFYAGDNDIGGGKSVEQVVADFKTFVAKVHGALPQTRILFIAIKPSLKRWNLVDQMREANSRIQKICESDDHLQFIDIDGPMLGPDGKPRPELFVEDGLHMTELGYSIWTEKLKPYL